MSNPRPSFSIPKGTVLNPNGRPPKDWTMASLIREAAEESDETGVPKNKIIAQKLIALATKGDMQAIKEYINRTDGMPKQSVTNLNVDVEQDESVPVEERLQKVLEEIKRLQQ